MAKNKMGRPPKTSKGRNIIFEALQYLPEDGSPIRFKDLRVKASMSSATLSKALFYLELTDQVIKSEVPSRRGKGVTYQKVTGDQFNIVSILQFLRKGVIEAKKEAETSEDDLRFFERQHYLALFSEISLITQIIFTALKFYADSDTNKKDAVLETYLYLINGLIKETSKALIDDIGMNNQTFGSCIKAFQNITVD
jgi:hypothetical protein